jgi:mannose-6-phosphate isomerase-like protein (cupin superfamily)
VDGIVMVGAQGGRRIDVGTQTLRVLSEGTDVHDVAVVDTLLPPGAGSGRHVHYGHEESFFVVEGSIRLEVDGDIVDAGPGCYAHAAQGQVHAFANVGTQPARMLAIYAPASALAYLDELARIVAADGSVDADALASFYRRFASAAG